MPQRRGTAPAVAPKSPSRDALSILMINVDADRFVEKGAGMYNYVVPSFGRAVLQQPDHLTFYGPTALRHAGKYHLED